MSKLTINEKYISDKLDFEKKAYDILHPYLLDEANSVWHVSEFYISGFQAVRQKDGVFAYFNENGSIKSHNYEDGDDIDGTKIIRELTYYEIKEYVDNDKFEIPFTLKKVKSEFVDESDKEYSDKPPYIQNLLKEIDRQQESGELDEFFESLEPKRLLTREQLGDIMDRVVSYMKKNDCHIDSDSMIYLDEEKKNEYGFTESELGDAFNDIFLDGEQEDMVEKNPYSTFSEEAFDFYHRDVRIRISLISGQGSFFRFEIIK